MLGGLLRESWNLRRRHLSFVGLFYLGSSCVQQYYGAIEAVLFSQSNYLFQE